MENYKILNVQFQYNGVTNCIHPVLLLNKQDTVLVDCGYPGFIDLIEDEMKNNGINPSDLTKIVLTHQDDDHIGAAPEFIQRYPHIQIVTSKVESPYISGKKKNLRLEQAEKMQELLPDSEKEFGIQFCEQLRNLKPVNVDIEVENHDCFEWGGGCEIISTLGHTPGHISILLRKDNILITGDAAVVEDGDLVIANPHFCLDIAEAEKSLAMIREMDCRQYICYHGGVFK